MIVSFLVEGQPRTKGSWTTMPRSGGGGGAVFLPGKTPEAREAYATWIAAVQQYARQAMALRDPIDGALTADVLFVLPRPKSVRRVWPEGQGDGDLDKYERAVFDACEGIVYTNDARICAHRSLKRYADLAAGERPHARMTFTGLRP